MINIKELERRWLKYKTKSFLLLGSIASIFGALIYGGYYILFKLSFEQNRDEIKKVVSKSDSNTSCVLDNRTKIVSKREKIEDNSSKKAKDEQLFLTPVIPIIEESDDRRTRANRSIKVRRSISKKVRYTAKVKSSIRKLPKPEPTPKQVLFNPKTKQKLEIKMSSQNYMQIMKEKFAKNKNPRDAILIAKAYFRAGNYEKSKEWALRANSLDKNLEESWIVFAKSKQMLGQRDEALNILITYYKKSRSKRVKELIEKIKTESI